MVDVDFTQCNASDGKCEDPIVIDIEGIYTGLTQEQLDQGFVNSIMIGVYWTLNTLLPIILYYAWRKTEIDGLT